ncbi:hypothetical protein HYT84_01380 [Candidatus Micrarchaeota archaeon]|nr:hypothetical protein [Candidatus Micrarchaeota archaeon]
MPNLESIRKLILNNKLKEAGSTLDGILKLNKNDDEAWYLRGVVSLKLNNHDYAQECFEHAIANKEKPEYYKISGMAHLEVFELEDAANEFQKATELDKKDPDNYFFIAVCYILMDNPLARNFIEKAYLRDKKKTKELLLKFYSNFIEKDHTIPKKMKIEIFDKLNKMN